MAIGRQRHRFTIGEYERMIEAGVLPEDDRTELLAGEIVEMSPIGIRHMNCVNRTGKLIGRTIGDDLILSVQYPIRLSNDGMPQPDLAVFADRGDDAPMPTDGEVLLVVEVSDSTRENDRQVKLPLYTAAGIPEAWLFDLATQTIERHTMPVDGRYTLIAVASPGGVLDSTIIPGLAVPASPSRRM
jgi:Uma2 family endonuclease